MKTETKAPEQSGEDNKYSDGNHGSHGNYYTHGNNYSDGNMWSWGNSNSSYNYSCKGNNWSWGNIVSDGNSCSRGNNNSHGTRHCFGLFGCQGAFNSAFCVGEAGIANCLFNKQSTPERCTEVISKLRKFAWFPKWTNILELKGGKEWREVDFSALIENGVKKAWEDMPAEMLKYIKSLPEYDEGIFKKITGGTE